MCDEPVCVVSRDLSRWRVRWDASLKKGDIQSHLGVFKSYSLPQPFSQEMLACPSRMDTQLSFENLCWERTGEETARGVRVPVCGKCVCLWNVGGFSRVVAEVLSGWQDFQVFHNKNTSNNYDENIV